MTKHVHILLLLILMVFSSCATESLEDIQPGKQQPATVLQISTGAVTKSLLPSGEEPADDALDFQVATLRVLAFNSGGQCVSNKAYHITSQDEIIKHEIDAGTYDFAFLANEPYTLYSSPLNSIANYTALQNLTFPASAVNTTLEIPMVQEIKNVEVLPQSGGAKKLPDNSTIYDPLVIDLSRLASRVDVLLTAEEDLDDYFTGITFSNVPDVVPLLSGDNTSATRNVSRSFTVTANSGHFTSLTPTPAQSAAGIVWVRQMTRFILPFSNFTPSDNPDKAVLFTIDMENRYSPSCKLMIWKSTDGGGATDNYTLPQDAALLLEGSIKMPLELNIQVTPWTPVNANWQVTDRYLHVSEIETNITDFNGARITFSSNLPKVYIEPDVPMVQTYPSSLTETCQTENVFNDLVLKTDDAPVVEGTKTTYSTSRFSYTYDSATKMGTGYMDILLDEYNIESSTASTFTATYGTNGQQAAFQLVLTGKDSYGGKLSREIKVNTRQYGIRFTGHQWGGQIYAGAFFRHDEGGERIISMQVPRTTKTGNIALWDAEVMPESLGKIVLSTSPSFDPDAGTDSPGDPELFPVLANEFKEYDLNRKRTAQGGGNLMYKGKEDGTLVAGRGRVYFRIGWIGSSMNEGDLPQYARIRLTYTQAGYDPDLDYPFVPGYIIYVRRGEEADYIMSPETSIDDGVLNGQPRAYARKFSAFNLTASNLSNSNFYPQISAPDAEGGKGVFVDYPSQGGALFQWGLPLGNNLMTIDGDGNTSSNVDLSSYFRRAYHSTVPSNQWESPAYPSGYWAVAGPTNYIPVWASVPSSSLSAYVGGYGDAHEVCPKGYHRPSDGYTDQVSFNGIYPNFKLTDGSGNYVDPLNDMVDIPAGSRTNNSSQIAYSEWRQSLWKNPWEGESTSGETYTTYNGRTVIRERSSPAYTLGPNYVNETGSDPNFFLQFGFYADGFFDRRPIKVVKIYGGAAKYGVALKTPQAAFIGSLIYNPETYASVFFPAAGRRSDTFKTGFIPGAMETTNSGYYWSSSASPSGPKASYLHNDAAWGIHMNYTEPGHIYTTKGYGYSIRCVEDFVIKVD